MSENDIYQLFSSFFRLYTGRPSLRQEMFSDRDGVNLRTGNDIKHLQVMPWEIIV